LATDEVTPLPPHPNDPPLVRTPFESLKLERLYRQPIDDPLDLAREAEAFRVEFDTIQPHEALAWNPPHEVHRGIAEPSIPNFPEPKILPTP
jgi:putative transposase